MKKLSKKEFIACFQLIIAILCGFCFFSLTVGENFPNNRDVFEAQCVFFITGAICLHFALSTWFYYSTVHRTRQQLRLFMAMVLWGLLIILIYFGRIGDIYDEAKFEFDGDNWNVLETTFLSVTSIMSYVVMILLFLLSVLLSILAIHSLLNA